jgi:hypothetical protein
MAFKLRSGNNTPFKQMGGDKETAEQYNATVKAEHEAKLQSYNDSTASYKNQVEIDNIQTYLENEVTEYDARLAATKDTLTSAEHEELVSSHNKQLDKGEKTMDKVFELHDENVERGIYDPKGVEWRGERNPDDLRPTKPREPMEMIDPIKIKNIDMGQVAEPQPTKALPYELVKNNAKYFTAEMKGKRGGSYIKGEDGKSEINLKDQAGNTVFTGSQTEFTEKYGDVLKRGSKKYGQEDREDRFYINR